MFRICVFICCMFCSSHIAISGDTTATHVAPLLIVVSDPEAASLLKPSPPGVAQRILIQQKDEPYESINARALAMRNARLYVYHSGYDSALSAMFRERLRMQGVEVVDLRSFMKKRTSPIELPERLIHVLLLATISTQSQSPRE